MTSSSAPPHRYWSWRTRQNDQGDQQEVRQHDAITLLTSMCIEGGMEVFYLTTHSTHFIYGYMASVIWLRTILIVRKETRCRHIGYSYRLSARVLLYAHPTDRITHTTAFVTPVVEHWLCASSARENENGQLPRELSSNQSCLWISVPERKLTSSTCSLCAKVNTNGSWSTKTILPSSASCVLSRLSVHRK